MEGERNGKHLRVAEVLQRIILKISKTQYGRIARQRNGGETVDEIAQFNADMERLEKRRARAERALGIPSLKTEPYYDREN